jgi:hypothetical protein
VSNILMSFSIYISEFGIVFLVPVGRYKNEDIRVARNDKIFYFDIVCNQIRLLYHLRAL